MPTFPEGFPLQPSDARGRHLQPGDLVKILVIPDSLTHDLPANEVPLLRSQVGTVRRLLRFDEYGFGWFGDEDEVGWFCLRPGWD